MTSAAAQAPAVPVIPKTMSRSNYNLIMTEYPKCTRDYLLRSIASGKRIIVDE